ncbi:MAG: NAD(P)-dependent oxidoreductase [Rhodospirillales bacterium]|nr:NAD(P)-dependent oxidoreductase [Rhodospirillales bacterium]
MKVGFIGLGNMGSGMAGNLLAAGHEVTVYNRTPERAQALIAKGAKAGASIAEACHGDAVLTMLADDEAVTRVALDAGGIRDSLAAGAIHVGCSTISVALSQRLTQAHAEGGQRYVAAPVFGRPEAAAAARLAVVAAGASDAVTEVRPLLEAIGQKLLVPSQTPADANLIKLSGNFLIATVIEALGEAMALVGKAGIDRQQYLRILTSTLFDAPVFHTYGGLVAEQRFEPAGFAAPLGLKDVRLVLAAGEASRVPLPIASLLRDRFLALLAQGGENLDWSAIGMLAARDAAAS